MRYRLRTLLIVLALGPMVLAGAWYVSGFGDPIYRRTLSDDSSIRGELLAATPIGTPAARVLPYVVNDLAHEGADGYSEWVRAYEASTGRDAAVTPTAHRTVVAKIGQRPAGPLNVENVEATWHFDESDQVSDITVERYTFGP